MRDRSNRFDPLVAKRRILDFISEYVSSAHAKGVVIGVSGGVDSALVAYLSALALGRKRVIGALIFEKSQELSIDHMDAKKIIASLGILSYELTIDNILVAFKKSLEQSRIRLGKLALGNIKARTRMVLLYALANQRNMLVAGTGDRSEAMIGYFTKYGDGGVDFSPIGHLYKGEVRLLAQSIGIPKSIANKPSSPNLWKGQKALQEIPVDYPVLDEILRSLLNEGEDESSIAKRLNIPRSIVEDVISRHKSNEHKLAAPASLLSWGSRSH